MEQGGVRVQAGMTLRSGPKWLVPLLAALLVLAAIFVLVAGGGASSERHLAITLTADQPGGLQVFYDHGAGFSEGESARMDVPTGSSTLSIPLPDVALKSLRLDPDPAVAKVQLHKIAIETSGQRQSLELPLLGLNPLSEIAAFDRAPTGITVRTVLGAKDPQLLLPVQDDLKPTGWMQNVGRASQALLLLALGFWVVVGLTRSQTGIPIPALLLGAWLLVAAMALTSTTSRSVHPDEHSHVTAARYYLNHWQPPAVDAPEIVDSYSIYGASYLNELDVVYLIAAKATKLWAGFGLDETTALRLFNVLLFGALLAVAWVRRSAWAVAAVLLLTPQLWYVFSYFNGDAFSLFLSLLAAMLFAAPDSPVSRFVEGERVSRLALFVFVLAIGLLLVSKRNYLPVVFVAGLSLTVRHLGLSVWGILLGTAGAALLSFKLVAGGELVHMFPNSARLFVPAGLVLLGLFVILVLWPVLRQPMLRLRLYRLGLLFALALVAASPRVAADMAVNGTSAQKSARMLIAAERHADPRFKPSTLETNPSASSPGFNLAAKGVTFSQIIGQPYGWATNSWRSLLGVYGYMNIFAPPLLYWLLGTGVLMLCFSMVGWALARAEARRDLVVAVAGIALVALSSIVFSWGTDIQAQGRYLFPGLAIIAIYLLSQPGLLRTRWASFGVALCFVGSVLSFVGVALPALTGS